VVTRITFTWNELLGILQRLATIPGLRKATNAKSRLYQQVR
jgi:hypothetical protein